VTARPRVDEAPACVAGPEAATLESIALGGMLIDPSLSAGLVAANYAAPLYASWRKISMTNVQDAIDLVADTVKSGDLSDIEKMLVSQAIALQTMFTTLAAKAGSTAVGANMAMLTNLALRAQAQGRATLDSLVNLKHPRTTVIAKQANVGGSGMQQVNNVLSPAHVPAHEAAQQNKMEVLEVGDGSTTLDAGATCPAIKNRSGDEAVEVGHRPTQRGGQGRGRR
jgi:hypothetical protein